MKEAITTNSDHEYLFKNKHNDNKDNKNKEVNTLLIKFLDIIYYQNFVLFF